MYRFGKLLYISRCKGNNVAFLRMFSGISSKVQESPYLRSVFQYMQSCKNVKLLNSLDSHRSNSSTVMSSKTSIDEQFRHLDYNQLIESMKDHVVIDVREKHELAETGTIPGSHNVPLGEIETAFNTPEDEFKIKYNFDKPSTEVPVIFSCRSGKRSLVALDKALAFGFQHAKHYKGGWLDWEKHLSQSSN